MRYVLITMFLLSALLATAGDARAQKTIRGMVTDAESGEPLPVAHIRVEGRFQGTITNSGGGYELTLDSLPADISVTYIGYHSARRRIGASSPDSLDIALAPNPVVLEEIVVTPEDPAVRIMREVIRRKPIWRNEMSNWRADAYTRTSLANDERIALMAESISTVYWDADAGTEEVILSKRQTRNIEIDDNFAMARIMPNLYDDDITLIGFDMIGVTHPDALDYYEFKLTGQRMRDDRRVYDISVMPKKKLQPSFVGTLSVLDGEYAMIAIDVTPNEAVMLPSPLNNFDIALEQQFDNFGGEYWLPVDVQVRGTLLLRLPGLKFPPLNYSQLTHLTGYDINIALPDSLFREKIRRVVIGANASRNSMSFSVGMAEEPMDETDAAPPTTKSPAPDIGPSASAITESGVAEPIGDIADDIETPVPRSGESVPSSPETTPADTALAAPSLTESARVDSIFAASPLVVPFSPDEERAYAEIDSTDNPDEAFQPTGFLVDTFGGGGKKQEKAPREPSAFGRAFARISGPFSPRVAFNRVDGGGLGVTFARTIRNRLDLSATGMYHTASEDWSHGAALDWRWGRDRRGVIGVEYATGTEPRYRSAVYPAIMNSAVSFVGGNDYYDYYHNERWGVRIGYAPRRFLSNVAIKYGGECHSSLDNITDYALFGDSNRRQNPVIGGGDLRSAALSARVGDSSDMPFGLAMQNSAVFDVEVSDPDVFGGDYRFTRYTIRADWRIDTFLRRRLMPNALDVRIMGGYTDGDTVPERFGALDGALGAFGPFGVFRTMRNRPMEGKHYAVVFWEHNFRTVPFELVGLRWFAEKGIGITMHGASGRTWRGDFPAGGYRYAADAVRHELGFSVNSIFGLLRFDVTKRLDRHGWFAGFGLARIL